MKVLRQSILAIYILWILAFILNLSNSPSLVVFSYITFFQFFIPGLALGASFGLFKRSFTEVILYSFILSYLVYLLAALPTLFFSVDWKLFVGLNICLYFLVLVIFLINSYQKSAFEFRKPEKNEIFIIGFGIAVILLFTYINFRSDASQYNNRISSSLQSKHVEGVYSSGWILSDKGKLSKKFQKAFHHDYKPYFNFLALPLKYSSLEQRYGWFIFTKLFIFLSIIAVYCLGRKLLGSLGGLLSVLFFIITIFVFGFYYGSNNIFDSGVLFAQMGYNRHVAENVFLFIFYIACIEAFRTRRKGSFLFAGLVLLCMLTIHQFALFWATANFALLSFMTFMVSAFRTKNVFVEFKIFLKNSMYVASFSVIYLVCLLIFTDYWNDAAYFSTTFQENYPGYQDGVMKITCIEQLRLFFNQANILAILSIMIGLPWLLVRFIARKDIISQFLLSNIFLYMILKSPVIFNWFMFNDMKIVATKFDGGLLFFIIVAFMIGCFLKKLKVKRSLFIYVTQALIVIIFVIFGTENNFAKELRNRKNAGYTNFEMTEYFKCLKKPSNDVDGFTVLTNLKTAVDVYAFFNACVFQYKKDLYWPLTLEMWRKDLDHILYCSEEDEKKLIDFIDNNRVDYIIVPNKGTLYRGKANSVNFDRAISFYNGLKTHELIYLDKYYYVFKKKII